MTGVLGVAPRSSSERGNAPIAIYFSKPLPPTTQLKVQIGTRYASHVVLQDPWTIHCLAPAGEAGDADVAVVDGERQLTKGTGAFSYVKGPGRKSSDHPGSRSTATNGGYAKPGDPTRPASNWWMYHRDLEHTSRVPRNGVMPMTKLWQRTFADALSFTQPIVGDETLLVGIWGNGNDAFAALDPGNGIVLWTRTKDQNGGASVLGTPVAVNGRVYFVEAYPGTMQLTCLNIADGLEVWSTALPSWSQAGLAAAFGNIYLLTRDGVLRAHDAATGVEVWQAAGIDVGYEGQVLSSPALGFGNVYVGTGQGLRAFNATTGAPVWSAVASPYNGNASPLLVYDVGVGNPAVVTIGAGDNILRAYHVTSGALLWEYVGDTPLWSTTPGTNGGRIYLMQERTVVELDVVSGALVKTSPNLGAEIAAAPTIAEDHLFAIMRDDRLVALTVNTLGLAEQWNIPSHRARSTPSVEEGRLFFYAGETDPYPAPADTIHAYHKGCLIATAAYGSPLAPQVVFLRNVRDRRLRRSTLGSIFIDGLEWIYYKFSPRVAKAMYRHPLLKRALRWFLVAPIVYFLLIIVRPTIAVWDSIRRVRN